MIDPTRENTPMVTTKDEIDQWKQENGLEMMDFFTTQKEKTYGNETKPYHHVCEVYLDMKTAMSFLISSHTGPNGHVATIEQVRPF